MMFFLAISITSCQRDELIESISLNEHYNGREADQINQRSFNQVDCGFNDAFCKKRDNRILAYHEPLKPCDWPCFTEGGNEENLNSRSILPVKIFDGTTAIFYDDGNDKYFIINSSHRAFQGKVIQRVIPNNVLNLLSVNYRDITDGSKVLEDIQSNNLISLTSIDGGKFRIDTNNNEGTTSSLIRYCDYYRSSDVDLFITTFFDENVDFGEVADLISEAYAAAQNNSECSISGYTEMGQSKCRYNCIKPRCIVDYILNSFTDDATKKSIQARYLSTVLNLTNDEAFWLENKANKETVSRIYNSLNQELNLNICEKEDCGLAGGYHEYIKRTMSGETLTASETSKLLEKFSRLYCHDTDIYNCFRDYQQNLVGNYGETTLMTISDCNPYQIPPVQLPACAESFPFTEITGTYYAQTDFINLGFWSESNPFNHVSFCLPNLCIQVPKQNSLGITFSEEQAAELVANAFDEARISVYYEVKANNIKLSAVAKIAFINFLNSELADAFLVTPSSVSVNQLPCNNGATTANFGVSIAGFCPTAGECI